MEGLPVEDLPDLLGHRDLPEAEETEETTTLGEVGSFARCANNSDTKKAILNALASSCYASCATLRGTTLRIAHIVQAHLPVNGVEKAPTTSWRTVRGIDRKWP